MGFVVDASALGKVVADEPNAEKFRDWFYATTETAVDLEAPELLWYEFGRLAQRHLPDQDAEMLADIVDVNLQPFILRQPSARAVTAFVARGLTFYDASYVALAEERGSILVTSDDTMAKVARRSGIPVRFY